MLRLFSNFDICLLPDTISEKRNGPAFRNEKAVGGIFNGSHEIRARLSIAEKGNVYCQLLLDCNLKDQVGFKGVKLCCITRTYNEEVHLNLIIHFEILKSNS